MDSSLLPNLRANQEESPLKACFNRVDLLAKALIEAIGIILVAAAALAGYKGIKLPLDSLNRATALFVILTLFFSLVLGLYAKYMPKINLTNWQYMLQLVLVSFGGVCLMCTNGLLLALINRVNALLACYLFAVPVVIGMFAYAGTQINGTNHLARDQAFEAVMKSCCDVAYLTVKGAFSMNVAVVFVYYKNPSLQVNQLPSVDLSVTFLGSVLGVFSMMVTAMPLELLPHVMRSNLVFLVKFLKYFMLFLTTTAAMTLGGRYLDGLVLLVLIPILVVIVTYQAMLLFTGEQVGPDPNNVNEEPDIPGMLTGVTNTCIILLSSVYALYTGGENVDVYFRVGIFLLVCIITSCLSWIALVVNSSMNEQQAKVTKLLIGIIMGLMITSAAAFFSKDLYPSL